VRSKLSSLFFSDAVSCRVQQFPASVLGSLLVISGVEVAKAAVRTRKEQGSPVSASEEKRNQLVFLLTAGVQLALKSGIAFAAGVAVHLVLLASDRCVRWNRTRRGDRPLNLQHVDSECGDLDGGSHVHDVDSQALAGNASLERYECGC
jgi:hypothetical protein